MSFCTKLFHKTMLPNTARRLFSNQPIGILGLPMCKGQKKEGTEITPETLRERGVVKLFEQIRPIKDFGDVDFSECGEYDGSRYMAASAKLIRSAVDSCLKHCSTLVTIGGDHSVAMGTVAGHADSAKRDGKETALLWVDAHADINTPTTSVSNSWHGMPNSLLIHEMRKFLPKMTSFSDWTSTIPASSAAFVGLRDVEPYERFFLDELRIASFSMREVDAFGIAEVTRFALNTIDPYVDKSLHVSFDVDALDPVHAPSTGTPVPGGLSLREAAVLAKTVTDGRRIRVIDLVEVNPLIGSHADVARTIDSANRIIRWFLGEERLSRRPISVDFTKLNHTKF